MPIPHDDLTSPWRTSSYCDTGGQCVEVAQAGPARLIRDSAAPAGPRLAFTPQAWTAFTSAIKHSPSGSA